MNDLQVGQKVWCLVYDFRGGYELKETEITKVGRKYVYVDLMHYNKYRLDTLIGACNGNYKGQMYLDKQTHLDEVERSANIKSIENAVRCCSHHITLEQSREILVILEEIKRQRMR